MTFEKELQILRDEHMSEFNRIMDEADRQEKGCGLDGPHCRKIQKLGESTFRKRDSLKKKYGIE